MVRTVVGVLRGGASSQYALSLKSGAAILSALPEDKYDTRDIFVDPHGVWHLHGTPATPARALAQIDVVLNAMHGGAGEDGTVARILERAGVPYALSQPSAAALSMHKVRARAALAHDNIRVPQGTSFSLDDNLSTADMARAVFAQFPPPYIVKPPMGGAGHGIRFARTLIELPDAIGYVLDASGAALIEEYVHGHEATVALIESFRNEDLYALPPAHVLAGDGMQHAAFGLPDMVEPEHRIPSDFSFEEKQMLMEAARAAHRTLGARHFSRTDLMMTPRAIYVLEVNTVPSLYPNAALPVMLDTVGSSVGEFAEHLIRLALDRV